MEKFVKQSIAAAYRVTATVMMAIFWRPLKISVVFGKPDYEENALALIPALANGYAGKVILICDDPDAVQGYLRTVSKVRHFDLTRVRLVRRSPLRALILQTVAELVLFTTPIYASGRPVGKRKHVNVWHGSGPKWNSSGKYSIKVGARYFCTCAEAWAPDGLRGLGMSESSELLIGNPRQDHFSPAAGDDAVESLGLDPRRPIVVWAPTYRESVRIGAGALRDGKPLSLLATGVEGDPIGSVMASVARRHGVQLVAKPHPVDADSYAAYGIATLTSEQIWAAGTTLHQFLGRTDAMISDYSSIWVDYLALNRSVGLFCPDLDEYSVNRRLNSPQLGEVADRLLFKEQSDVEEFFAAVASGGVFRPRDLAATKEAIGFVECESRVDLMFDQLGVLGR